MNEDSQPNERPLNRKGGAIPVISSKRGRGWSTFNHGGRVHSPSRHHYNKSVTASPPGSYPPFASHYYQDTPLFKRQQSQAYGSSSKRRRIEHTDSELLLPTALPPVQLSTRPESCSLLPKPPMQNVEFEPVEILVDLPLNCRKGAPNRKATTKKWLDGQTQELSTKTGVRLRFGGYLDGCARFVVDGTPTPSMEGGNDGLYCTTVQPSTEPLHSPNSNVITWDSSVNDEVIIAENIDDLESPLKFMLPENALNLGIPNCSVCEMQSNPNDPYSRASRIEPLRIFSSGVLSFSSEVGETSLAPETIRRMGVSTSSLMPPMREGCDGKGIKAGSEMSGDTPSPLPLFSDSLVGGQVSTTVVQGPSIEIDPSPALPSPEIQMIGGASRLLGHSSPTYRLLKEDLCTQLPLPQSDRARRILSCDPMSLVAVSMRGSIDLVNISPIRHRTLRTARLPGEQIDDACLLSVGDEFVTIFGHARDHDQATWCTMKPRTD
ncbi:hypothetical protein Hypma_010397 [Hypsizygus marmoreus]|uniref:Uncharacterized protein n=1 Tax=Hypsizygus marmoreus TaxID=39966 RepID=A0A369JVH9_HYPMA|nr:hypothetical protein Hypma_010397 [Hypsizygus marmoreus]